MGNEYQGKKYKGIFDGTLRFIATLHTWGRSSTLHPHLHVLLMAGGLKDDKTWEEAKGDFLVSAKNCLFSSFAFEKKIRHLKKSRLKLLF
ncbi:MAG: transposase [Cocleimonas sp.]|nr:transposase [Cocleimonas sp.]